MENYMFIVLLIYSILSIKYKVLSNNIGLSMNNQFVLLI